MRFSELPTPCYVINETQLEQNLAILQGVARRTGCKILLAQKAFCCPAVYPLIRQYLAGTTASGLYEARLGREEMGGEVHIFSPGYQAKDMAEIIRLADHIVFNSNRQLAEFGPIAKAAGKSVGLRVNPEYSTQNHAIYDPCAPGSRLGVRIADFNESLLHLLDGLHMHTLCEQNSDALIATVAALEEKFGKYLPQMRWLNLGGGHHITRADYDIPALEQCITRLSRQYKLQVYLEPGEAVALNAGYLQATVLDIVPADMLVAILDASAACHMPDVLEMPYTPPLLNAAPSGKLPHTYRLAGATCLAGDVIGEYSFASPLAPGDRLIFSDMAIYTMVKNNTFNGMPLPDIYLQNKNGDCRLYKRFGYADFKSRI
ncbi:MAG TPA: carboxynorspermidine decarboxylase [Candidatus Avidehalobacter gallistercoris]|uniref:Carboxynorspermidine decarboxylase n=1 Tax=Candidatus Avidehalobacter gallistercoris TaxID=2840694 RepID=A0A9D1HIF2_9FIRM|nr:carboxynorspermidine decarboxylase [Candidatus Avidehalobacter gallistercoris]